MKKIFAFAVLGAIVLSCGSPKTTIRVTNKADGTDTRINVTQGDGGSTSVTVNPSVNASIDSVNFTIR